MWRHAERMRTTAWVALITAALLTAGGSAQAHYVWLEREGDAAARAYFGEFGEDLREKSGGALDRIAAPRAFMADPAAGLRIERRGDHLEITAAPAGDLRLVEAAMAPREDRRAGGKTKTIFYAREGRSETRAHLDLELVPVTPARQRVHPPAPRSAGRQGRGEGVRAAALGEGLPHRRSGAGDDHHAVARALRRGGGPPRGAARRSGRRRPRSPSPCRHAVVRGRPGHRVDREVSAPTRRR